MVSIVAAKSNLLFVLHQPNDYEVKGNQRFFFIPAVVCAPYASPKRDAIPCWQTIWKRSTSATTPSDGV